MSASSRRAVTSAARGTGTATRERSATRRRSCTCRCSKRPATCRPRSTRTRPRSSSTVSASASTSGCTTTPCSTPRSRTSRGTTPGSRWIIRTNRGDEFTAQFVAMGTGPLHVPKLPGIAGHRVVHRTLVPHEPVGLRLHGRRLVGRPDGQARRQARRASSGPARRRSSACLISARACKELYVFQRTPSSVDVRNNQPTDPEWFAEIATPGWQQRWLDNFTANQTGGMVEEDLVMDGWTDLARRIRSRIMSLPPEELHARRRCWRRSRTPTSRRWRRSARGSTRSSRIPRPLRT